MEAAQVRATGRSGEWFAWHGGPWLVALFLCITVLLAPATLVERVGPWFFLSSVLLFGLSHGAADVWLARRLSACEDRRWSAVCFVAAYLAMMGLVLAVWKLVPLFAFAGFLVLTAWHWGSAEVVPTSRRAAGTAVVTRSLARGAWVILAPFAWHYERVSELLASWGWWSAAAPVPWLWSGQGSWLVLWWLAVAADVVLAGLGRNGRSSSGGGFWYRIEVAMLVPMAVILPPLWWVGMYFMAFHAWRHGLRLARLDDGGRSEHGSFMHPRPVGLMRGALRCLLLDHRGYWAAALVLLLPLGWWWHGRLDTGVLSWTGVYVMWLAALTLPHALLVRRLDRWETAAAARGRVSLRTADPDPPG